MKEEELERLFLLSIVVLYTYIWLFYSPLSLKSTRSPFGELSVEEDGDHSRKTAALHINEGGHKQDRRPRVVQILQKILCTKLSQF